jgi:predicted MFS family arabinose efflux permease
MLAPTVIAVIFGMLMGSIGKQGIAVVTVSLIATHLTSDANRATGFAALGMASPFGYLVTPIAAGLLLDATNWRVAVGLWVFVAVVATGAALMLLPPDGPRERAGELWTPALAGLVLVGVVQCIRLVNLEGLTAPRTLIWLAIALISLLALWQLMVRLHEPTLDLAILKKGSAVLLLVVIMLLSFTNLYYYFSIGVQRVYGFSATQVALLLVPCQLAGIAGAWIAGRGIKRRGLRVVGTVMLLGVSAALLLTATQ